MKNKDRERQSSQSENHSDQSEVARRAYELYEARGGEPGDELEDWLQAEREVKKNDQVIHSEGREKD